MAQQSDDGFHLSTNETIKFAMALHDPSITVLNIRGRPYYPTTNKAGCRTFSIGEYQFLTQNPNKANSESAKLAREGHKLTWIIKFRQWGLVQDGNIVRKSPITNPSLADYVDPIQPSKTNPDQNNLMDQDQQGSGPIKRPKLKEEAQNENKALVSNLFSISNNPIHSDQKSEKYEYPKSGVTFELAQADIKPPLKPEMIRSLTDPTAENSQNDMDTIKIDTDIKEVSNSYKEDHAMENHPIVKSDQNSTFSSAFSNSVIDWKEIKLGIKLGSGAFGEVRKGTWRDTPVAIKILHSNETANSFFQEAALLCKLRHPNIVSCLGVCVEEPNQAIVMELMPSNLTQYIKENGPLKIEAILPIAIGIAQGIAFLHQRSPRIIHRDLKPDNILMGAGNIPKIGDFGISKENLATATQTKIGTPSYAAPELLNDEKYGTAVDIYSMGLILYSMVIGSPPWTSSARKAAPLNAMQIMMKVAIQRERPIIPASTHPELSAIIKDCWNHFPKQRPTSSKLLERLVQLSESLSKQQNISVQTQEETTVIVELSATQTEPIVAASKSTVSLASDPDQTIPISDTSIDTLESLAFENRRVTRSRTRQTTNLAASKSGSLASSKQTGSTTIVEPQSSDMSTTRTSGRTKRKREQMQLSGDSLKLAVYQREVDEFSRKWSAGK